MPFRRRRGARSGLLAALFLSLLLAAPAAWSQEPAAQKSPPLPEDLGQLIPAGTLVHASLDGIDPVSKSIQAFVDAVNPGSGAFVPMMMMKILPPPIMNEIAKDKPLGVSLLSGGTTVINVPLADPEKFEGLLKTDATLSEFALIPGKGYSLLVSPATTTLEDLRKGESPKPSTLSAQIHGFIDVAQLFKIYGQQINGFLGMMALTSPQPESIAPVINMVKALPETLPRIEFGATPAATGLGLTFAAQPAEHSALSKLATGSAQPVPLEFLRVLPDDGFWAMSGSLDVESWKGFADAYLTFVASKLSKEDKAAIHDVIDAIMKTLRGDIGAAISIGPKGAEFSVVELFGLTDVEGFKSSFRAMLEKQEVWQHFLASLYPDMKLQMELKPDAGKVNDDSYDAVKFTVSMPEKLPPETAAAMQMMKEMYAEPLRILYHGNLAILTMGPDGEAHLRQTLDNLGMPAEKGKALPAAAAKLDRDAAFSMAIDPVEYLKLIFRAMGSAAPKVPEKALEAAKGSGFITMSLKGHANTLRIDMHLPSSALHSFVMLASSAQSQTVKGGGAQGKEHGEGGDDEGMEGGDDGDGH